MKVSICGTEYEVEHGRYSASAPYNSVICNVGGYMDPYDKKIVIHVWNMDTYKNQKDVVEEVIWYELLCAFAYEFDRVVLWNDSDTDADANHIVAGISAHMSELLEAFYDIKTDINHYIHTHKKRKEGRYENLRSSEDYDNRLSR